MSVVNAMRSQKKKEEEEQQKQVVGQQQKTQSNASKPTGSTSIPKDNQGISRTQKSAASSLRTENNITTSRRSDNTSVNRNTITANISEQRQMSDRRGSQRRENFNPLSENRTTTSNLPGPDMLPKLAEQRRSNTQNAQNTQNPQNIPDNLLKEYASKNGISYEEARKRFDDASNMRNQTITKPGQLNEDASTKARADRAEEIRKANQRQQSAFEAGLTNMGKTLADPVNLLPFAVGKLTGQNYDLVGERAREAERQATEQHPVASALGDIAGFLVGNKILRGGKATENALNAGDVLKTARDDALLNGATKGQALLNGISNAARTTGLNAVKEFAKTDLPLDTLPYVMNSIIEGKSNKGIARDAALNVGANVGFNAIGDILSAGKALNDVRRSANNAAIDEIAQNAARQSEEAARNMNNLAQTIPDVPEEVLRSATDSPYRNAEQIISPADTNKALGNNEYQYIKEQAIKRLTDLGGDENQQLYANLVRSADEDNLNAFNRALSDYREATGGRFDRQLNRLEDAVNGRVPKDVPENLYADIHTNIDSIEDGLNHISSLEGLSELGQTHLANSRALLEQYEDAVRNGGDVQGIAADLNRALGNLNNQAKKVDGYNKVFNQWKGGDNPRGNLYSSSSKVLNVDNLSPEDEAMIREWIANEGEEYKPARPANQPVNQPTNVPSAEELPQAVPDAVNTDGLRIESVNLAGGRKGYYVAEGDMNAWQNAEPGKVYPSKEEAEAALNDYAVRRANAPAPEVEVPTTELPEANAPESGNFLDDFARSQNETPAAPVSNENVLPPTQEANVVSNEGDRVVSQARTNVFERSGIDEAESKNIYTPEDYTYVKETNAGQLDNATSWLNELGDDAVPYYANKDFSKDKATIRDVDSMMMLTERLRNQARETTDAVEKARLYAESKDLSIKSVQAASQFGKDLQSWSKWADTPERVIDKGYGVMLNRVEDFFKSNPKAKWGISDVSKNIEELFKQNNIAEVMASGDKKAIADLKREISNGIDEIIKGANKQTRKALEGMSEADIEQLMYENSMKGINQALEMFAGTGSMGLKDSTIDKIFEIMAKNEGLNAHSKEFVQNEKKMYSLIANDISKGGTFGQKFDTWRYVSMLSNPSTHLRNLTGNITMQGVSGVKNNVAAIIEAAADRASKGGIDRTKGLLNPFKDGDLITASNNDALEHAYRELSGHRYSGMAKGIESETKAFKNKGVGKAINKLSDINSGALSAEDEFFKVREYSTALAGYLKGNGFDASIFDDGLSRENAAKLEKIFSKGQRSRIGIDTPEAMREQFLQDARAYAINKANVQTFNNTNVIANKISQVTQDLRNSDRKDAKAFGYALDVTVPFKNVPANVLNTAIAYSPAEWVKVLSDTNKLVKGSMSAAEYIDEIATATTGTLGMMLGGYLAHEGILHIGAEKGKRERAYDKATDNMNNAISIGGHSMDLTQLIPAAAPLIFGATVYDVLSSKGNGLSAIDTMTSGLSALADGVTDMTMLSGLADILQTNKYSDESIWGSIATKVTQNAANQLVPTVGGKIEKVFDDTQRNSWYTGKEGIADKVEQTARYNISKIPGAQNLGERLKGSDNKTLSNIGDLLALQPRIDSKGEAMQNKGENAVGRLANAVLPLELGNDRSTETDNKLRELASTLPAGEERDKLFPYAKQSEAKFNNSSDEQIQLTPDQWTQYQQNKGQMTTDMLDKFLNGNIYESLDNATRTSTITNMYDFATKYNQNKIADGAMSKDMQALADIYDKEGSEGVIKYLAGKGIAEAAGVRGNAYAAKDIAESTAEGDIKEAYKKADIVSQLADHGLTDKYSYEGFQQASTVIPNLSVDDYAKTLNTINEDDKPNIKQEELAHYLNKQKVTSESEAKRITEAYGKDTWKAEPKLVDGEWTFKKPKKEKGSTKSKESKTELTPTGNNNMDTLLKAKQKAREDAKSNNPPGAEDLPEAEAAQETSSGGLNWALNNGYDLQSTQTYSRAKAAGVSDADFNTAWWAADADGNGYMKKAEAWNYASQFPTKEEQQKWFHILYKGR